MLQEHKEDPVEASPSPGGDLVAGCSQGSQGITLRAAEKRDCGDLAKLMHEIPKVSTRTGRSVT